MNLAYLATPYTLFPRGHDAAFEEAAKLAARLFVVAGGNLFSPIVHCHPLSVHGGLDPLDLKLWIPFCETMLGCSNTLIVAHMESWERSKGMAHEIAKAAEWRIPIFDLVDLETLTLRRRSEAA